MRCQVGLVFVEPANLTEFSPSGEPLLTAVELVAFAFSLFIIYGCGPAAVLYGLMLLLLGIPVYVWQRRRSLSSPTAAGG